jgi:hypothetical protein
MLAQVLEDALREAPPDIPDLFYRGDWPRLLSHDPLERWRVTRRDRITPTLRWLRANRDFRVARECVLRVICKHLPPEERDFFSPARCRRALSEFYSADGAIDLDEITRELAAWDVAALWLALDPSATRAEQNGLHAGPDVARLTAEERCIQIYSTCATQTSPFGR